MSRVIKAVLCTAVMAAPAFAQTQAEIANRLNDEGKQELIAKNWPQASAKFREAVARVPEAKYFMNLCVSLSMEGKLGEALTACDAVEKNSPTPEQREKAQKMAAKITDEAKAQGLNVEPTGGGSATINCAENPQAQGCAAPPPTCQTNPGLPECNQQVVVQQPQRPMVVGRPLNGTGLFTSTTPDNKYVWTIGFDVFGGGGQIGQKDAFGTAAAGVRFKGDFMLDPAARIGGQGYVQYASFAEGEEQQGLGVPTLDVLDVGVAIYKHLCPPGTARLCITPLLGAHVSFMSPQFDEDEDGTKLFNYAAAGGRAEVGLEYAFGSRYEHVLSVSVGANLYSATLAGPSRDNIDGFLTAEEVGLDKAGAVGYLGVGYTHRFNTPLGSSPFITLE
jgi:hypothetical protein